MEILILLVICQIFGGKYSTFHSRVPSIPYIRMTTFAEILETTFDYLVKGAE
jgi:hypothetical protein